ncbi:hypothetical protein ACFLY4_10095 [Chloroflexota bacterium]
MIHSVYWLRGKPKEGNKIISDRTVNRIAIASLALAGIALFGVAPLNILFDFSQTICFWFAGVSLVCSIIAFVLGLSSFLYSDKGSRTRFIAALAIFIGIIAWPIFLITALYVLPWGI